MIPISMNKVRKTALFYIKNKVPFTYEVSLSNISIKCELGSYTSNNRDFPAHELYFIKKVKNHVLGSAKTNDLISESKVSNKSPIYFSYSKNIKPGQIFKHAYNIDITSAYWYAAKQLGIIDDEIFAEGLKVSKKTRLACIGSLAKKTSLYEFDGVKQKHIRDDVAPTAPLWNIICHKVSDVLIECAKKVSPGFIFFWVDGIYVSNLESAKRAASVFKKLGYDSKIEKLNSIKITSNKILVHTGVIKERIIDGVRVSSDAKPFHFNPKTNRI